VSNPAARKGNQEGEIPVEQNFVARGFLRVYRLRQQGTIDKGDIGGIDDVCIEVKNHGVYKFGPWMKELAVEKANKAAAIGALIVKPKGIGKTRVGQWWVVMTVSDFQRLLIEAKYGPYVEPTEEHENVGG
jgi:hypothetical protein